LLKAGKGPSPSHLLSRGTARLAGRKYSRKGTIAELNTTRREKGMPFEKVEEGGSSESIMGSVGRKEAEAGYRWRSQGGRHRVDEGVTRGEIKVLRGEQWDIESEGGGG